MKSLPQSEKYIPGRIDDLKERFGKLVTFITERGGFVTSIPGAERVVFECVPGSTLPDALTRAGYDVGPADPPEGERILPTAIIEHFTRNGAGDLVALSAGSTLPVAETRRHAGIVKVMRYAFSL